MLRVDPPPVPSFCVDLTPPASWPEYWHLSRDGTMAMPPLVWKDYWHRFEEGTQPVPPIPQYLRRFLPAEERVVKKPREETGWDDRKHGYRLLEGRMVFYHPDERLFSNVTGADQWGPPERLDLMDQRRYDFSPPQSHKQSTPESYPHTAPTLTQIPRPKRLGDDITGASSNKPTTTGIDAKQLTKRAKQKLERINAACKTQSAAKFMIPKDSSDDEDDI